MIRLNLLGRLDLTAADGSEVRAILSQPKPLAVLAYLSAASPAGYRRRDELLGLLWPETTTTRGRRSLSQVLHVLRTALGTTVIDSRGDEEVGIDPTALSCDVTDFRTALNDGRRKDAVTLYRGDFLSGFFVADSPDFEQWVSRERLVLREKAVAAALSLSSNAVNAGDLQTARTWAHRSTEISPYDEASLRQLMDTLARAGDRAGAVMAFNAFEKRLDQELEIKPSPQTMAMIAGIRSAAAPVRSPETVSRESSPDDVGSAARDSATIENPRIAATRPGAAPRRDEATWSGRTKVLAALVGAAVVAMAGFMSSRVEGGASEISRADANREAVLVAQFGSLAADSALASAVGEAIRLDLSQSPVLRLLTGSDIRNALRLMRRDTMTALDSTVAREIAEREGVKAVVEGDIRRAGPGFVVSARLVRSSTGELIEGWRATARDSSEIIAAVDELTTSLRREVGEPLRSIRANSRLLRVSTRSLPALRKHAMALSAFYAEDYSRSIALFEEAIALDSTFADAHIGLGTALALAGIKPARQIEAAIRAYELRNKVDEAERYGVIGTYLSRVKGNRQGAIDAYQNQLNLDPTLAFYGALGSLLIQTRRYADAERVLLKGIEVAPTSIVYLHLANARLSQGRNADARATIDSGIARLPNHALLDGLSIDFEVALGNHAVADSLAHALPAGSSRESSLRHQARVDGVRGKFGEAIAHLRDLRARQNAEGPTPGGLTTLLTIARMQLLGLSDTAAALREIDSGRIRLEMAALDPRERPYVSVAHLLAAAGRPEPARAILREYDANVPPDFRAADRWLLLRTTALLKLADGKTETAISDLRFASDQEAMPLGSLVELAAAYKSAGAADSSSAVYRRYLDWKGMRRVDGDTFYLQKVLKESGAPR